jgi:uncharacterized protein (DUF1778 family)
MGAVDVQAVAHHGGLPYICTDSQEEPMPAATARIEVRVSPDLKAQIEHAAQLDASSVSNFVVAAAKDKAEQVMREHETHTSVPADFFDRLVASLDEPDETNPALVKAVRRSRVRAEQF